MNPIRHKHPRGQISLHRTVEDIPVSRRSRSITTMIAGICLACFTCSLLTAPAGNTPHIKGVIYADYNSEVRETTARVDGIRHVDTPRLIQKLKAGSITTYAYLVWHQKTDWDDFRLEFLPAAQVAGLNVWLYLTPPSENNPPEGYVPFGTNYIQWAEETAKLASNYPALSALVIDDFNGNLALFTPGYVSNMMSAAHVYCTNLMFLPVNYDVSHNLTSPTRNISTAFANSYGPYCGGVIFPYLNWANRSSVENESDQIVHNSDLMRGKHSQFVVQFPSSTTSSPGDYAALSKYISHPNGFPDVPFPFTFRVYDSYTGTTSNYHKLQVLAGHEIVWESDTAGDAGMQAVTLNLQSQIRGSRVSLITARVYDVRGVSNYRVTASWNVPPGDWKIGESGAFTGTSAYYPANPGLDVPLIVMIYDGGYGSGTNRWTPTLDYVRRANEIAFESVRTRHAAGIIQYCLDKTATSQQFPVVRDLYAQWVNHPWFDPVMVLGNGGIVLSGGNGSARQSFTLKSTTALPNAYSNWSIVTNGFFDSAGDFSHKIDGSSGETSLFYRLSVP